MNAHLEITTKIGCKLACKFCPQKTLVTNYSDKSNTLLDFDNYKKFLETVPTSVDIHFSGFSEPFLNTETPNMIKYAIEKGHVVHLYSTLVGLDEYGVEILKQYKPFFTRIHIADQKAMKVADEKWIQHHDLFLKTGITGSYMAMGEVTETIAEYLNNKNIRYEIPNMLSRGGNLDLNQNYISGNLICGMDRWHQNVILPNGDVYTCCMDYGLTMPIGNLLKDHYSEIWNKAELYKHNINPPKESICRKCEWAVPI
jgi:radical SAM protein with 4Fe4S-binding SPASM domain